jgi:hypothetical protein
MHIDKTEAGAVRINALPHPPNSNGHYSGSFIALLSARACAFGFRSSEFLRTSVFGFRICPPLLSQVRRGDPARGRGKRFDAAPTSGIFVCLPHP